jgi:hypothetical protein
MEQKKFAADFNTFLNSLSPNTILGNWHYTGKTNVAFGTPGGAWENTDGFEFRNTSNSNRYILRSISKDRSYIVIESFQIPGQLYNMDLTKDKIHGNINNSSSLYESYKMTSGLGGVKTELVKKQFEKIGVTENKIFTINDNNPDWSGLTVALLKWAELREIIKNNLKLLKNPKANSADAIEINTEKHISLKSPNALNQIIYGPPGTGKTYNTINKALEIINDDEVKLLDWRDRVQVKDLFDKKVQQGQIVFTTFHQSMSYEDFIEGIKPLTPMMGDAFVKYDVVPGIFKNLCTRAKSNYENSKSGNNTRISFEKAFYKLRDEWEDFKELKFPLKTKGYDFTITGFTETSIQFKKASGGTGHTLSINTLRDLYYGKEYDFNAGVGIYYPGILKKLNTYNDEQNVFMDLKMQIDIPVEKSVVELINYVIIIDEINRGNVSQIFGELITLIEDDKRLGKQESLEVELPYSKTKFGVPPNLYILGTMNTADRSVEALDTALRRRFTFEEMPPKYDLSELQYSFAGVKVFEILQIINKRIEKLLDKDHLIGHSFFIRKDNESEKSAIMKAFHKNIIPLLQEYFFGDYGKIGLVIGNGFFEVQSTNNDNIFADFEYDGRDSLEGRQVYKLKDFLKSNDSKGFEEAITILMNKKS